MTRQRERDLKRDNKIGKKKEDKIERKKTTQRQPVREKDDEREKDDKLEKERKRKKEKDDKLERRTTIQGSEKGKPKKKREVKLFDSVTCQPLLSYLLSNFV